MPRVTGISSRNLPTEFAALVRLMPPSAIPDDVAYGNAINMVDALTALPKLTSDQARYLNTLAILIHAYEAERDPIDTSRVKPIDVLKHLMAEHGMGASDLGRLLGERSLGSKILGGSRDLSKSHIRTLASHFGVRADLFL